MAIAAAHLVLLAAYTFPEALVPGRLRVAAQLYARPLFHQQWRLFAPDPPLCACRLQWSADGARWHEIAYGPDTYLDRRVRQALARHAQERLQQGEASLSVPDARALRGIVYHGAYDPARGIVPATLRVRLVERCVTDAARPAQRAERITPLQLP